MAGNAARFSGGGTDDVDRVRDAADIVRVVGQHVALKPKGREYVGLCPFHSDTKPSMNVVPAKQIFHCFACGTGGDVFSFVQKFHKMEFREALEYLADMTGVELRPRKPQGQLQADTGPTRTDVLGAAGYAAGFYRAILAHPEHGAAARAVVSRRGISPDMVAKFGIGASPDRWDGLLMAVRNKGLDARAFEQAGLFKQRDSGGAYDAFRNRLMFPIWDRAGRVVAFGARRIDENDEPKYLNSPETRLFNKSSTLYAMHLASKAIQVERTAIITEGYMDALACHQAGFENAVATLGTALTPGHVELLEPLCDRVVALFDGDNAGQRASQRAIDVVMDEWLRAAFGRAIELRICVLADHTDAKDPDELLKREDGPDVFRAAIAASRDVLDYRFDLLRKRIPDVDSVAFVKAVEEELEKLGAAGFAEMPAIRQHHYLQRIVRYTGLDEGTIRRAMPAGRKGRAFSAAEAPESIEPADAIHKRPLTPAEHLLGCLLCDGALIAALAGEQQELIAPGVYRSALVSQIAQAVQELGSAGSTPDLPMVLRALSDAEVKAAAVALASRIDTETDRKSDRLLAHFRECLRRAGLDAAVRAPKPEPGSALGAIEAKRSLFASHGPDRRKLPRPR